MTDKEYFHVDLTTAQTGLSDNHITVVDFGGKGTVKYDTKSNFDSANDAYLLGSSDGVYLISFSLGIRSATISTEDIIDAAAAVFVATDGSTFVAVNGAGSRIVDQSSLRVGSVMYTGSFIYKSTTATTKVLLKGHANTSTSSSSFSESADANANDVTGFDTARCTFLSIARIA